MLLGNGTLKPHASFMWWLFPFHFININFSTSINCNFFFPLFIMWKVEKGGWKNKLLCMRKCSLTTMCGWGGQGQFRDLLKRWRNTHLLGSPKGSRKNPQDSKNKAGKKFRLAGYRCHKEKADVKYEPTGLMRKSGNRWVRWLNGGNVPGSLFPTYTSIKHISVTTSFNISLYVFYQTHGKFNIQR